MWGRRIERVGRSKLFQKNLTEPDVELFMNLTHRIWFVSWIAESLANT